MSDAVWQRVVWQRGLLASVRDAGEARIAADAAAAIIDVKEPRRGPLGRADAAVAAAILTAVAGRAVVTLACGELAADGDAIAPHVADIVRQLPPGVAGPVAVKAGPAAISRAAWRDRYAWLAGQLPEGTELVAVAYADAEQAAAPPAEVILEDAIAAAAATVLVDTFDKQGPGLFAVASGERIRSWLATAAAAGVALALAGRLSRADLELAWSLGADVCGVRSAACEGGRHGRLSARRLRSLVTLSREPRSRRGAAESSRRRST